MDTPQSNSAPQSQPSDQVAKMREELQQKIVNIITKKLESGEMTEERAKAIAKMTLEKLPEGIGYEEFMKIVPTLDDEFEELRMAVLPIILEYQKKVAAKVEKMVSDFMKDKKYAQALQLAQQAIAFDNKLVS